MRLVVTEVHGPEAARPGNGEGRVGWLIFLFGWEAWAMVSVLRRSTEHPWDARQCGWHTTCSHLHNLTTGTPCVALDNRNLLQRAVSRWLLRITTKLCETFYHRRQKAEASHVTRAESRSHNSHDLEAQLADHRFISRIHPHSSVPTPIHPRSSLSRGSATCCPGNLTFTDMCSYPASTTGAAVGGGGQYVGVACLPCSVAYPRVRQQASGCQYPLSSHIHSQGCGQDQRGQPKRRQEPGP